jgi:hypothetical protein
MKGIAQTVGMEKQNFMSDDKYKGFKKQIAKDTTDIMRQDINFEKDGSTPSTINLPMDGEPYKKLGESFTKEWWKKQLFTEEESIDECISIAKMFDGGMVLAKNRDRNYKPRLKIVRDRTSYGIEVCYIIDVETDWTEGMNEHGIGVVNSALFVKRDEKDFDKSKKKKAPSKDGVRVREALGKGTFADTVKSLALYHDGIKGHTTVGNGKKLVSIENTSRTNPVVKIKDVSKEPLVRTNHGIYHPEQGYQRGPDKLSSQLRMTNALNVAQNTSDWQNLFPNVYKHTQEKGPKFDLVRAQNKLWTSSQLAMNLNKREIILYLIPYQHTQLDLESNIVLSLFY